MRLTDLPDGLNALSGIVLDAAIEVHRNLGNKLTERTYRDCLAHELRLRGSRAEVEAPLPLKYKDLLVPDAFSVDILVEDRLVVELKCVDALGPEHEAQTITYLHMSGCRLGLLINFHAPRIREGFRRIAH